MGAQAEESLRFLRELPDPRAANARYLLGDTLSIAIMAVFCGAAGWATVEQWAYGGLS